MRMMKMARGLLSVTAVALMACMLSMTEATTVSADIYKKQVGEVPTLSTVRRAKADIVGGGLGGWHLIMTCTRTNLGNEIMQLTFFRPDYSSSVTWGNVIRVSAGGQYYRYPTPSKAFLFYDPVTGTTVDSSTSTGDYVNMGITVLVLVNTTPI